MDVNDSLGFSWDVERYDGEIFDYYSLSPEIENFPLTEDICAEIACGDAECRYVQEEIDRWNEEHRA